MLNTNWSTQGMWTKLGARMDVRYEHIDQDELLHESHSHENSEDHREKNTINDNVQLTLDYAFNQTYGVSINLPVVSREHTHFHINPNDPADSEKEVWDFTKPSDARVIGRMQLSPETSLHDAYGINLGVKLPTGDYRVTNENGELAERSLQPGTGTTDAILGAYYHQQLANMNSQWFAQITFITPLNSRVQFKSGNQFIVDLGYRHTLSHNFSGMLQLNLNNKQRDSGEQAEPENSGGTFVFLSPGLSYSLDKSTQVYGFIHHRLVQSVNGEQLSGKDSFVMGFSTRF